MRPLPTFPPASRRPPAPWLLAALAMLAATPAHAETADGLGRQGNKLYAEKRVDEAVDAYSRAIELEPQSAALLYNLGTALALKDKHDEAEKALQQAATLAKAPQLRTDANFNRAYNLAAPAMQATKIGTDAPPPGAPPSNAQPPMKYEDQIARLEEAQQILRQTILDAPEDVELVGNYEKIRLAIEELKKKLEEQKQQQQQNQQGQGDQKSQQQDQQGKGDQGQQQQNQQGDQQGQQQQGQQQGQQPQQNQQGDQQKSQDQQGDQPKSQDQPQDQQQKQDPQAGKDGQPQQSPQQQQQQQQPQNQQGQGEKESDTPRASQQSGLEGQATPTPTPAPQGQQQAAGQAGQAGKPDSKPEGSAVGGSTAQPSQPLTPERANAQRLLNMLEEENPEQFRKLFQFRGQAEEPPARDW